MASRRTVAMFTVSTRGGILGYEIAALRSRTPVDHRGRALFRFSGSNEKMDVAGPGNAKQASETRRLCGHGPWTFAGLRIQVIKSFDFIPEVV